MRDLIVSDLARVACHRMVFSGDSRSACALHQRVGPSGGMWILFFRFSSTLTSPKYEQDGTAPLTTVVPVVWTAGVVYGVGQALRKKPVRKTLKEPSADHRSDPRSSLEAPGGTRSCSRHRNFSQGVHVFHF